MLQRNQFNLVAPRDSRGCEPARSGPVRRRGRAIIRIATLLAPCATAIFSQPGLSCSGARSKHHGGLGGATGTTFFEGEGIATMTSAGYWKSHYVLETDADEIERNLGSSIFVSGATRFELLTVERGKDAPNILISPGSAGHSYVFAELGYQMHLRGYNVFIMPKHGGATVGELVRRHGDALEHISGVFSDRIGVFGEGLGGFAVFYLALSHGPIRSAVYQNAPGVLTERQFLESVVKSRGAGQRRRLILPAARLLSRIVPWVRVPVSLYLDFEELIDKEENREVETRLVKEGYLRDSGFDRWYPLSAVMSLVSTPPPNPISELKVPTMFLVPLRGWTDPSYLSDLYRRLPPITKRLVEVNGGVFWMCSHPKEAAKIICEWFDETV